MRKSAPTFQDAWELYRSFQITRGEKRAVGSKSRAGWKPRTANENSRLATKFLLPRFGNRLITELDKSDVVRLHSDLASTPRQANLCLQLLSGFFNWLVKYGHPHPSANPVFGIERYDEIARDRYLNEQELQRLGAAISSYRATAQNNNSLVQVSEVNALKLLVFSGMRKSEVLGLKWDWVDLVKSKITLPDSKTGAKEVVLNDPAISCIKEQQRIVGNPYVFVGGKSGQHLATISRIWECVRKDASLEDVRIHDLRHTVGSTGVAVGAHMRLIAGILGHQSTRTTERYVHADLTPLQDAAHAIGNKIASALNNRMTTE
ncbi:MAG: site-specific integrase [Aquisalinus sp.]|nr:site-specific integrase [Aquisalinus sp.]